LIDFRHRSDNNIDFFVAGYGAGKIDSVYKEVPNTGWTYSSEGANKLINELELSTTWEYSGGCDLLLLNAKYKESNKHVALDYATAVVLQLDTMIEQKAINDIAMFFEEIFRYAKTCSGQDPCWGFSDKIGVKKGLPAILHMVSKAIPGISFDEIQKLKNFAVRDISRT
jgi:hypothetical protein